MKVLFVVNPNSGKNNERDVEGKLLRLVEKNGFGHQIIHTEGSDDDKKINRAIEEFRPETVVAVGGDGTVNLIATQLIQHNIHLGIIPTGSANGLAHNLGIPKDIEGAFSNLVQGVPKPLDAITLNEKYYCFHLSDTGINARVVKSFEEHGSKGLTGYAKQLFREMLSKKSSFRAFLETKDFNKNVKAEMIVIANAQNFGTGAQINPTGKLDDGKFEIVVIKPYPWWYIFTIGFSFFTGKLNTLNNVKTYSIDEATITFKKPQDLQNDGEIVEGITTLEVGIMPGALTVYY